MARGRLFVWTLALGLPALILAPVWPLAGLGAGEDDVLYYYPTRALFGEMLSSGDWPWLNTWNGLGQPYLADPQTAVFYPFTWLFAALPPQVAYPLHLWLHYSIAFLGMYRLLRTLGLRQPAAVFGAIGFAFSGFVLAHRAHLTLQAAAAWTPWVLWRLRGYLETGGGRRLTGAVFVLALQCFAGHLQIALLSALGAVVYLIAERGLRPADLIRIAIVGICNVGVFAIQWMPTASYLTECTRADRELWMFLESSWNPLSLVLLVLPMFFGQRTPNFFDQPWWGPWHQSEQLAYAGLAPLLLTALLLRPGWRAEPHRRAWFLVAGVGAVLALGHFTPIYPLLYTLPGASLFRVPARALLLLAMAVPALAAIAAQDLSAALTPARARLRAALQSWMRRPWLTALLMVSVPLGVVALLLPLMSAPMRSAAISAFNPANPAVWAPLLMALLTCGVLSNIAFRWDRPARVWLLPLLVTLDLAVLGWTIDVPAAARSADDLLNPAARAEWLPYVSGSAERLWVLAPRGSSGPGEYRDPVERGVSNTNFLARVRGLTLYGPLQPKSLARLFQFAPWGETPLGLYLIGDTTWMRAFGVGWVLLCDPTWPAPDRLDPVTTTSTGLRLFRISGNWGPAYFWPLSPEVRVSVERERPYRFRTTIVATPGDAAGEELRLVVARLYLPGWSARTGSGELPVEPAFGALLSVRVPHQPAVIEWAYEPPGLGAGAMVSAGSALILLAIAIAERLMRRTRRADQ